MKHFQTSTDTFSKLQAEEVAGLVAAATDIALVIDADGVIRDLSCSTEEIPDTDYKAWIGQPWLETVTVESRAKVEALLNEAGTEPAAQWRHINHPSRQGNDLPILYRTVPIGNAGKKLAVGRSAVNVAELQQKLLQAQQTLEKNYLKFRHLETRYRLLFQDCWEAVFIIDTRNLKVLEANPAAGQLLGDGKSKIPGQRFTGFFEPDNRSIIENLLVDVQSTGQRTEARAKLLGEEETSLLSASLFYQEEGSQFLVSVSQARVHSRQKAGAKIQNKLVQVIESSPDAFVLTGADGRIITANPAFIELTQTASEDRVRGKSLDRWFGRSGVDLNVLLANLRKHGSVRLFATTLRGDGGSSVEVEVSAARVSTNDDQTGYGFMIRDIGVRLDDGSTKQRRLSRPVEQLTELVGRLPLKDLVQESTDMVERYCIEAALEITGENRTSAAEILGLSRQSLYVKLRRHGLANFASEDVK